MQIVATVTQVIAPRATLSVVPAPTCIIDVVVTGAIGNAYASGDISGLAFLQASAQRVRSMIGAFTGVSVMTGTGGRMRGVSGVISGSCTLTGGAGRRRGMAGSSAGISTLFGAATVASDGGSSGFDASFDSSFN